MSEFAQELLAEQQGYQITDDAKAEWAVKKIKEAQEDTKRWNEHFAGQLAKIKAANDNTVMVMTNMLADYFAAVPHKDTKTTSKYELPSATLVRKAQQPEYVRDDARLLAWLDEGERPECIKITRAPDWSAVKKGGTVLGDALIDDETGEVIPGVTVIARPDKFDVQIKEG